LLKRSPIFFSSFGNENGTKRWAKILLGDDTGEDAVMPPAFRFRCVEGWISTGFPCVAQLVEALHYKPVGRGFDSRWCHWNFLLTQSFRSQYGLGLDSASNKYEYQEYFLGGKGARCVRPTSLALSCADCLEMWEI